MAESMTSAADEGAHIREGVCVCVFARKFVAGSFDFAWLAFLHLQGAQTAR